MALGISRSYIAGVGYQGFINRVASSSRISASSPYYTHHPLTLSTRGYAAASNSATKKASQPKLKRKTAVQTPTSSVAKEVAAGKSVSQEAKPKAEPQKSMTDMGLDEQAEEIARLERSMAFSHLMPTIDPWGQQIQDSLDVTIPRPFDLTLATKDPKKLYTNFAEKTKNWMKNAAALSTLISDDAIPGRSFANLSRWAQIRASFGFIGTQSVKPDSALAPLRQIALESYEDLNKALASRNEKNLKQLTTASYQRQILDLCKTSKSKNPRGRLFWKLHRYVEPVRIVSLRVTQGYLGPTEPRFGNRLMVHALVKFDTEQSLEMYNERGVTLHTPAEGEVEWISDTDKREEWRVPAQRKRVTEYLVLEKRMWVLGPWQFREQLW